MLITAAVLASVVYTLIVAMTGTLLLDSPEHHQTDPEQNGRTALTQIIGLDIASVSVGPMRSNP